jgi:hypothetical protein
LVPVANGGLFFEMRLGQPFAFSLAFDVRLRFDADGIGGIDDAQS